MINNLIIHTMVTGIATRQGPLSRHCIYLRSNSSVSSIWSLATLIAVCIYREEFCAVFNAQLCRSLPQD